MWNLTNVTNSWLNRLFSFRFLPDACCYSVWMQCFTTSSSHNSKCKELKCCRCLGIGWALPKFEWKKYYCSYLNSLWSCWWAPFPTPFPDLSRLDGTKRGKLAFWAVISPSDCVSRIHPNSIKVLIEIDYNKMVQVFGSKEMPRASNSQ